MQLLTILVQKLEKFCYFHSFVLNGKTLLNKCVWGKVKSSKHLPLGIFNKPYL